MIPNTEKEMDELLKRLFPIARSITGKGVRETLRILQEYVPLEVHEVPSGTKVLDWTVPPEWEIRDAYIRDPRGRKFAEYERSNLHILNYSIPIRKKVPLEELQKHLYSMPEHPDAIPYRTSYYTPQWGFCIPDRERKRLKKGTYEAVIDSTLKKGSLTWGELLIRGKRKEEILISCYVCHPSLCNDNLSGVVLAAFLARELRKTKNEYSYRFLFIPETIGAIAWLAKNRKVVPRIRHGLVATCVGDRGPFTYKKSRRGNAPIDRAAEYVLANSGAKYSVVDFFPAGSDERQFCSPGFNLPVGSLMRSMYDTFPEYHSSADDLSFVKGKYIAETLRKYQDVLFILERDATYCNTQPYGEPQLGKRGVYGTVGGEKQKLSVDLSAVRWVLNLSDGEHSLLDIAIRSKLPFARIVEAARTLKQARLLRPSPPARSLQAPAR